MFSNLPVLRVGLGFRTPFRSDLFHHRDEVDFLEITLDHYLDAPPEKEQELNLLADHFVLIPHGLNLSLGSADGIDKIYLAKLARLIKRVHPPWWSEHIAFTRAGGIQIGHLSPVPFTREAIAAFCRNIAVVRRLIEVPLLLENITYTVALPGSEMGEADFIAELLEQTDSGLLLDMTNLHTNAVNHGYDPDNFLKRLPLDRVTQLHFAGGHWRQNILVDSHAHPTPPEVWAWIDEVFARAPVKAAVLERDDNLPPFQRLLDEARRAREMGRRHSRWS
jgi:uncharacterized protein (UPF0276 family)